MWCSGIITLVLTCFWICRADALGPKCFEGTKLPHPRDSDTITQCGEHEECSVAGVVTSGGSTLFNMGCKPKESCKSGSPLVGRSLNSLVRRDDVQFCSECCQNEFCNNQGCGLTAFPNATRGRYCYSCDFQMNPTACNVVKICKQDELCIQHVNLKFAGVQEKLYTTGCIPSQQCKALERVLWSSGVCATCCNSDFCNTRCENGATAAPIPTHGVTAAPATSPAVVIATTKATPHPTTRKTTVRTTVHTSKPSGHDNFCPNTNGYGRMTVDQTQQCVKVHREHVDWYTAAETCNREHASLVILDTAEKMLNLELHAPNYGTQDYWIGLNDRQLNYHFQWQTSKHTLGGHDYSNWGPSQPEHRSDQGCVYLKASDSYKWHDGSCGINRKAFVCEYQRHHLNGGLQACQHTHWGHRQKHCANPAPYGGGHNCDGQSTSC